MVAGSPRPACHARVPRVLVVRRRPPPSSHGRGAHWTSEARPGRRASPPGPGAVHRAFQPVAGGRTLCQCLASSQVAAERASELILEPACATGPWFLQGPSTGGPGPFKNLNQNQDDPTAAPTEHPRPFIGGCACSLRMTAHGPVTSMDTTTASGRRQEEHPS